MKERGNFCVAVILDASIARSIAFLRRLRACRNDRLRHRNGAVSEAGAPIAGAKIAAASPSQTATVTTRCIGTLYDALAGSRHLHRSSSRRPASKPRPPAVSRSSLIRSQSLRISLVQPSIRRSPRSPRAPMDVVKPGTTTDVYSVNSTVTQAAAGSRRRRKLEQRVLGDRHNTRRIRAAQPARLGPSRLHSRRELRPGRLRVRRRSG